MAQENKSQKSQDSNIFGDSTKAKVDKAAGSPQANPETPQSLPQTNGDAEEAEPKEEVSREGKIQRLSEELGMTYNQVKKIVRIVEEVGKL